MPGAFLCGAATAAAQSVSTRQRAQIAHADRAQRWRPAHHRGRGTTRARDVRGTRHHVATGYSSSSARTRTTIKPASRRGSQSIEHTSESGFWRRPRHVARIARPRWSSCPRPSVRSRRAAAVHRPGPAERPCSPAAPAGRPQRSSSHRRGADQPGARAPMRYSCCCFPRVEGCPAPGTERVEVDHLAGGRGLVTE